MYVIKMKRNPKILAQESFFLLKNMKQQCFDIWSQWCHNFCFNKRLYQTLLNCFYHKDMTNGNLLNIIFSVFLELYYKFTRCLNNLGATPRQFFMLAMENTMNNHKDKHTCFLLLFFFGGGGACVCVFICFCCKIIIGHPLDRPEVYVYTNHTLWTSIHFISIID